MVRVKHRYFLVHILYPDAPSSLFRSPDPGFPDALRAHQPTPDAITSSILLTEIREQISALFGDYGAGVAGSNLNIKYLSSATSTFILRCPRAQFRLVWAALTMMTALPLPKSASAEFGAHGQHRLPCVLRVIRVSGTIRKAEEAAVAEAKRAIARAQAGNNEYSVLEGLIPKTASDEEDDVDQGSEDEAMETDED